jgi:hypothetical protein
VKCFSCDQPMRSDVDDFDYTRLAGLRGKTVTLVDVLIFRCEGCGSFADFVKIARIADLQCELDATKGLNVKRLRCRFTDDKWVIAMLSPPKRSSKRRGA